MSQDAVVDASVAVKWIIEEEGSDRAERFLEGVGKIHAPKIILGEVANAIWKQVRRGAVGLDEALWNLDKFPIYINTLFEVDEMMVDALSMACALDHPVYDCIYMVGARHFDLPLVTSDARMVRKFSASPYARHIIPLSEWHP